MRTYAAGFAAVSLGMFLLALTADAREQGPAGLTIQPARPAPTIGGVTVTGRVLVDEGRPRPIFQFALSDASGAWFSPSTDRSGLGTFASATVSGRVPPPNLPVFSMDLPAGDYRPVISGLPPGYTVKSIESDSIDLTIQPLKVVAGGRPPQFTVRIGVTNGPPWIKVRGRLVNFNVSSKAAEELNRARLSSPISIMLISPAFSEYFAAPVATDGTFDFPAVLPGTYEVRLAPNIPSLPASIVVGDKDLLNVEIKAP